MYSLTDGAARWMLVQKCFHVIVNNLLWLNRAKLSWSNWEVVETTSLIVLMALEKSRSRELLVLPPHLYLSLHETTVHRKGFFNFYNKLPKRKTLLLSDFRILLFKDSQAFFGKASGPWLLQISAVRFSLPEFSKIWFLQFFTKVKSVMTKTNSCTVAGKSSHFHIFCYCFASQRESFSVECIWISVRQNINAIFSIFNPVCNDTNKN